MGEWRWELRSRAEKSMILHKVDGALGSTKAALWPQTPPPSMCRVRPRDATHSKVLQSRVREIHTPPLDV